MSLVEWLAADPERCAEGYHRVQHPLLCDCNTGSEWSIFTAALRQAVRANGEVHQRDVRPHIQGIPPKHRGLLWRRARTEGLVSEIGHERSDDIAGRNAGRMEPYYSWAGGAA